MASDIFERFDADQNGTLDKEEAKNVFMDQLRRTGMARVAFNQ